MNIKRKRAGVGWFYREPWEREAVGGRRFFFSSTESVPLPRSCAYQAVNGGEEASCRSYLLDLVGTVSSLCLP
jgi:hypothetical protein